MYVSWSKPTTALNNSRISVVNTVGAFAPAHGYFGTCFQEAAFRSVVQGPDSFSLGALSSPQAS